MSDTTTARAADFDPPRLWLDPPGSASGSAPLGRGSDPSAATPPQTRLLRRRFVCDALPAAAVLRLFADSRYQVWINGRYLGRGPILHHGNRLPIARYDLREHLVVGDNVLAVLVHSVGCSLHAHVPTGLPGLAADLTLTDHAGRATVIATDEQWRITDRTGWSSDVPRRGWAIGHVEVFHAADHPQGWTAPDFDDSQWHKPDVHATARPAPDGVYFDDPLPPLDVQWRPARDVVSFHELRDPPPQVRPDMRHGDYAKQLMDTAWHEPTAVALQGSLDGEGGGLRITGLTPGRGAVLNLDLGAEHSGQVVLECHCPSAGVIDVGWSEWIDADRPRVLQKGQSYVDQVHAVPGVPGVPGALRWEPIQFNAGRYVSLWFRGFTGELAIERVGMRATEPALDWQAKFESSDASLDALWALCRRTLAVGRQEGVMDCPTREQAAYIGDGHPVARWIAQCTGDARHWRYLVREQFARQSSNGLIRSTPFSGRDDTLIDYTLLAIVGTRDYLQCTGDAAGVRDLLPACHRVLGWFDRQRDSRGLFNWQWQGPPRGGGGWENVYNPDGPAISEGLNLFIDHAGMGWHNPGEPGIDRRGINAAINMLLVTAREALADLEDAVGSTAKADALRAAAAASRDVATRSFFNAGRGVFIDGELDGQPLAQVSEHTNAWAALAGAGDHATRAEALRRALGPGDDIARGGPYFWHYIFPAMTGHGLHAEALEATRTRWAPMLDRDATCVWETFRGDDHDTACHPWSAAPVEFLLTAVAGLPSAAAAGDHLDLRPRYDLLDRVAARIITAAGPVAIDWRRDGDDVQLAGELPAGLTATLHAPDGSTSKLGSGKWTLQLAAAPASTGG